MQQAIQSYIIEKRVAPLVWQRCQGLRHCAIAGRATTRDSCRQNSVIAAATLREKRCIPCEEAQESLDFMGLCESMAENEAQHLLSQVALPDNLTQPDESGSCKPRIFLKKVCLFNVPLVRLLQKTLSPPETNSALPVLTVSILLG